MNKIIAYTPADNNNLPLFEKLEKSLRKFHSAEELPLMRFDNPNPADKDFWYRATPLIAQKLFLEGYDTVVKLDADQIILGSLEGIWQGEFDVATVLNDPSYPIQTWDIQPYFNNGLVVIKSKEFADHWARLCFTPHFNNYQFREQDLLNILASDYHNYKVKILDDSKIYGEWGKPLWTQAVLKENKIMLPFQDRELQLCVYHSGGGNTPDKGNYRLRFSPEVSDYIDTLIK